MNATDESLGVVRDGEDAGQATPHRGDEPQPASQSTVQGQQQQLDNVHQPPGDTSPVHEEAIGWRPGESVEEAVRRIWEHWRHRIWDTEAVLRDCNSVLPVPDEELARDIYDAIGSLRQSEDIMECQTERARQTAKTEQPAATKTHWPEKSAEQPDQNLVATTEKPAAEVHPVNLLPPLDQKLSDKEWAAFKVELKNDRRDHWRYVSKLR